MIFIGVDGCKKGWFAVKLTDCFEWETRVFENIDALWADFHNAAVILIDIPIGLKEFGVEERGCDVEARRLLGNKRGSSVFSPPCRDAVYSSLDKASQVNFEYTKKKLPRQTIGIISKIRKVDEFLDTEKAARSVIRETHPELCFWALAGCHSMVNRKREPNGILERERVLQSIFLLTKDVVDHASKAYRRKEVAKDDILDALAVAITAKMGFGRFLTLPEKPPVDSKGLRMEMVYFDLKGRGK